MSEQPCTVKGFAHSGRPGLDIKVDDATPVTVGRFQEIVRPRARRDVSTIDVTGATFVTPEGLVVLAAVVDHLSGRRPVEFIRPANPDVANYLSRMTLGRHLDRHGVVHDLPPVTHHDTGDRLHELSRFEGVDAADELAARVYGVFAGRPHAAELYGVVHEIAQNVLDHSGRLGGYLAMQQYVNGTHPRVTFAIGDVGVGLRASLSTVMDVTDDAAAIALAARSGVTSTGSSSRGYGLNRAIRTASRYGGSITVYTGRVGVTIASTDPAGSVNRNALVLGSVDTLTVRLPGTLVVASMWLR